jgi:hypothetical protein
MAVRLAARVVRAAAVAKLGSQACFAVGVADAICRDIVCSFAGTELGLAAFRSEAETIFLSTVAIAAAAVSVL